MFQLSCKDMGNVDCDFVASGETKDECMQNGMMHGMSAHGMTEADMTPEKRATAEQLVKEV